MSAFELDALGIYISIPFCRSKCTYCNFASGVFPASDHARYVERVTADLAGAGVWSEKIGVELPRRVDTVYLGGGTPSLLAPELVAQLFSSLRAEFDLRNEKINYKVREHSLAKIPVLLVVGKREAEERTVSIRRLGTQDQVSLRLDAALAALAGEATPPDLRRAEAVNAPALIEA